MNRPHKVSEMTEVRIFETKSGGYELGRVERAEDGVITRVQLVPRVMLTPDEVESAVCNGVEDVLALEGLEEGVEVTQAIG